MGFAVMSMTDRAAERVREIVASRENAHGIRVGVKKGGCAGMEYTVDLVTAPNPKDDHVEHDGAHVYVAPEARGRGVGEALLQALIAAVRALGFRQIVAVIGDGGPASASVRLHEKLGFSHSGRLSGSGYKHGRWLDTVFMQLELNGGTTLPPDPQSWPERRFRGG